MNLVTQCGDHMSSDEIMIMNSEVEDLEASGGGLIEVLSRHLPGGTESN
jgi:hypothetical protein